MSLREALDAFQRVAGHNARAAAALAVRHGVTPIHLKALLILAARGSLTASALGTAVGLSSGAITPLIDKLERNGHAERNSVESDRRSVVVTILPAGLVVVADIRNSFAAVFTRAFSDRDLVTAAAVLTAFGHALETEVATW